MMNINEFLGAFWKFWAYLRFFEPFWTFLSLLEAFESLDVFWAFFPMSLFESPKVRKLILDAFRLLFIFAGHTIE